ncbi:MAG: DUF6492 family protein [Pseudomonadota bacterium]
MPDTLLTVITPSYRNDFDLVTDLCKSMDQFLRIPFKHVLIVPNADLAMFAGLNGANRSVLSEEALLRPSGFRKIPFPKRIRIPGIIDKRFREQWWCRGVGRVNGWVTQQLIKLSASDLSQTDLIMFIDSDNVLFRPLELAHLYQGSQVKLGQRAMRPDMQSHFQWHANGLSLLGIEGFSGQHFNYIGNLIVWKRAALVGLQQRIAQVSGLDWRIAVARVKAVSEYILYGLYCEQVAKDQSYHAFVEPELTCSFWTSEADLKVAEMAKTVLPTHVALHIQSTIPMPLERRRDIIRQLAAVAPSPGRSAAG